MAKTYMVTGRPQYPDPKRGWYEGRLRDVGTNVIVRAMKEKKLNRYDIADALKVHYQTACVMVRNPDKFTRQHIRILARLLDLDDESLRQLAKGE